ncbi:uncharacterized protein LOC127850515 isoform X2 [Dreissena polymorpha]|nr:uncharacterized protein LOC127850515 isoform X2 [Dreissena polymorpha]
MMYKAQRDDIRQKISMLIEDAEQTAKQLSAQSEHFTASVKEHERNIVHYMQEEDYWLADCKLIDSIENHVKRIEDYKTNIDRDQIDTVSETDIYQRNGNEYQHAAGDCHNTWVSLGNDINTKKGSNEVRIPDDGARHKYKALMNKRQKAFYNRLCANEQIMKEQCEEIEKLIQPGGLGKSRWVIHLGFRCCHQR